MGPPNATPIWIAAAQAWLPPDRDLASDALADERVDQDTAQRLGYHGLSTSNDRSGPEMAVLAARKALADAGWDGGGVGLVAHAWLYHQGHDFWSAPHYVAHHVGAGRAEPVGVQQTSNGCAAAVRLVASRMAVDPDLERCVVTTGDRFSPPGFDRWRSDFDVAYGDGGTALLLERSPGPYRLLSAASVSAPEFEVMYRGSQPFTTMPRSEPGPVDARRPKVAFRESGQFPRFALTLRRAVQQVIRSALADADLTPDSAALRCLVLPRIGSFVLRDFFVPSIGELEMRQVEVLDLGRGSGHLGAGDPAANLAEVHSRGTLAPGSVALLLSMGNGHTWSCLAVRRE